MYGNLRIFRESLGLTQKEFASSLSIGLTTYNGYETGARDPKSDFWIAVAKKYHVTIDYLMGFSNDREPHYILEDDSASDEQHLLGNYRMLNEEGQEKLMDYSDDIASMSKYKKHSESGMDQKKA